MRLLSVLTRSRRRLFALAAAALAVGSALPAISSASAGAVTPKLLGPGDHTITLTVGGYHRSLLLHVPPSPAVAHRPLLLIFHGHGDTAQSTENATDFSEVANSTGEVVAYLQGINNAWNEQARAGETQPNDVAYTTAVITLLEKDVSFDHSRIVAVGFSNGALMVEDLGCKLANKLAMVVPVEGEIVVSTAAACKPARPISVYEVHGTADTAIPYNGGQFGGSGGPTVLSAPKTVARWAQLDHCAATAKTIYPSSSVKLTSYAKCKKSVHVTLRTLFGGVHQWTHNIGTIVYGALPS